MLKKVLLVIGIFIALNIILNIVFKLIGFAIGFAFKVAFTALLIGGGIMVFKAVNQKLIGK